MRLSRLRSAAPRARSSRRDRSRSAASLGAGGWLDEQATLKARVSRLEARADAVDAQQSAIKVLQGALEALKEQVIEMRQDLKNLMTGRIGASRRGDGKEG